MTTLRLAVGILLGLGVVVGPEDCFGPGPPTGPPAQLRVSASVPPVGETMVVEVEGPGIGETLVFNVEIVDGAADAVLRIPAGRDRTVTGRIYDAGGIETHRGAVTLDVFPGRATDPVELPLLPLTGDQVLVITLGGPRVLVVPDSVTLEPGQTAFLTATVRDGAGNVIHAVPTWASADPAVATVRDGVVTGVAPGTASIHATYGPATGTATVTVTSGGP